jgi:hypothetical protein
MSPRIVSFFPIGNARYGASSPRIRLVFGERQI